MIASPDDIAAYESTIGRKMNCAEDITAFEKVTGKRIKYELEQILTAQYPADGKEEDWERKEM